jgi:hypothetical protein
MVIEHDVPDVPDRQVQLAEGVPDLARGPAMAVEQPQRRQPAVREGTWPAHDGRA